MDKKSGVGVSQNSHDEVTEEVVAKPKHSSWYRSWRMLNKDQRGALITVVFLAVFLPITALAVRSEQLTRGRAADPVTPPTSSPSPIPNPEIACAESGGVWKLFNNICADNCDSGPTCQQTRVYSCDCGNLACWSGATCIANPSPTPTSTPAPSGSPRPNQIPNPSSSPQP